MPDCIFLAAGTPPPGEQTAFLTYFTFKSLFTCFRSASGPIPSLFYHFKQKVKQIVIQLFCFWQVTTTINDKTLHNINVLSTIHMYINFKEKKCCFFPITKLTLYTGTGYNSCVFILLLNYWGYTVCIRSQFFTVRVTDLWNQVPSDIKK